MTGGLAENGIEIAAGALVGVPTVLLFWSQIYRRLISNNVENKAVESNSETMALLVKSLGDQVDRLTKSNERYAESIIALSEENRRTHKELTKINEERAVISSLLRKMRHENELLGKEVKKLNVIIEDFRK